MRVRLALLLLAPGGPGEDGLEVLVRDGFKPLQESGRPRHNHTGIDAARASSSTSSPPGRDSA